MTTEVKKNFFFHVVLSNESGGRKILRSEICRLSLKMVVALSFNTTEEPEFFFTTVAKNHREIRIKISLEFIVKLQVS